MKINEILVVEGKNDSANLKRYFNCDTIITGGLALTKEKLDTIKLAQQNRGVIVFTDPDKPGERIRSKINEYVEGCKNAFIDKKKARTTKKVGVEHANEEDLKQSLENLMTFTHDFKETISWEEYLSLGLTGRENSSDLRSYLGERLFLGKANAKTLFKRLNMLQCSYEDIVKMLEEMK